MTATRVVVTGASGFVGRSVVRGLAARGCDVVPIASDLTCMDAPWQSSEGALAGAAVLVHLAAAGTRSGNRTWRGLVGPNVAGTLSLVTAGLAAGVTRVVSMGSALEYGGRGSMPDALCNAGAQVPYREDEVAAPREPYGATKLAGAELVLAAAREAGASAYHLRACAMYGNDGPASDLLAAVIARATGAGEVLAVSPGAQIREWVHVEDVARAVVSAALDAEPRVGLVNVASGAPETVAAIVGRTLRALGAPSTSVRLGARPYRDGEPHYLALDIARARAWLDWTPRIPLEDGIRSASAALAGGAG